MNRGKNNRGSRNPWKLVLCQLNRVGLTHRQHTVDKALAALGVLAFAFACGPTRQNAPLSKPILQENVKPEVAAAQPDAGPESQEPNIPFAMIGGGPTHLHRASIPGPKSLPREQTRFRAGARIFASPVIGPDGTIYVGSVDGTFSALRINGTLRWSYICDAPIFATAAVSQSGTVYTGCDDDTLLAFGTNGTLRWIYDMKQDADSSPVIGDNGVIYVGGDSLYAIAPGGARYWNVWLGGHVSAPPAVRPDGTIVVGSHDHRLYAVLKDGTVSWSFATAGAILGPVAVLLNNDVVFGSDDGFVYRLAGDGKMVWKFKTGGKVQAGIAVSKDEDFLYAASMDGNLYALYPELGEEKWRVQTAGPIRASPMLDSEARIYVGSRDHNLYAVDTAGGDLLWRLDLGCEIDSTAAVVADRGLVVGSDDGVVHVFKEMQ